MRLPRFHGLRRRLSYANVMATLAFFFALTGAATAGVKYVAANDPIPSTSDLTGTYDSPLIGNGKVTNGKIADAAVSTAKIANGAVTSNKFDSSAVAPSAASIGGLDVVVVSTRVTVSPGLSGGPVELTCPGDRLAVHTRLGAHDPDISLERPGYTRDAGTFGDTSTAFVFLDNSGSTTESGTAELLCLGG